MENVFGRTEENWYLKELPQNQKVEFNNGVIKGNGSICGIASESVAILGKGYIVKPKLDTFEFITEGDFAEYNYSHLVIFEIHLTPIE